MERALDPFPVAVRTKDALRIASMDFLVRQGQRVSLASYDERLVTAAKRMKIGAVEL